MRKTATSDDFPSGRVLEQGLDWFFMAIEACSGGTPDLGLFLGVSIFIGIFGVDNKLGGPRGAHKIGGRSLGGDGLHPCGFLVSLLAQLFCFGGFFWSMKNHCKFSAHLDSVWYSFSAKL